MANSKHGEGILETIRGSDITECTLSGQPIAIIGIDTYPEETNNIILLGNGKRITTDDLEFANWEIVDKNTLHIHLGNYKFVGHKRD